MLIKDLLLENDVKDDIVNDLMDFFAMYKQKDITEVPVNGPNGILVYLRNLGHTVDIHGLMPVLAKPPFDEIVERTTPETIKIKSNRLEQPVSTSKKEKSQDHVKKVASKAATKAVKTGDKI
jgi:hypothetical protein